MIGINIVLALYYSICVVFSLGIQIFLVSLGTFVTVILIKEL